MIKKLLNYFFGKKKEKWFYFENKDPNCPHVRYRYQGTRLEVNKEDALDRALYILNKDMNEIRKNKNLE